MSFSNGNYLVVGGRTGISRVVLDRLIEAQANVWCASRQPPEGYDQSRATYLELDATANDLSVLSRELPAQLHGLVYCPGSIALKPFHALTDDDFQHDLEVNLLGAVRVLRQCHDKLKAAGGASVVLFSTVAARAGMRYHASVAAAKAAVEGLAVSVAAEWAAEQIRVNVVAPSLTDTPLAGRLLADDKRRAAAAERHPLRRFGRPEDIASAVVYLLSDEAGWITGQLLGVDGGMATLRMF